MPKRWLRALDGGMGAPAGDSEDAFITTTIGVRLSAKAAVGDPDDTGPQWVAEAVVGDFGSTWKPSGRIPLSVISRVEN